MPDLTTSSVVDVFMGAANHPAMQEALGPARPAAAGSLGDMATITLSKVFCERSFNPLPAEFEVLNTRFETGVEFELSAGASIAENGLRIASDPSGGVQARPLAGKLAIPCVATEIEVDFSNVSGATQYIAAGICKSYTLSPTNNGLTNSITAFWNKATSELNWVIRRAGVETVGASPFTWAPTSAFKLMVMIYGPNITVMADFGRGYKLIKIFAEVLPAVWNIQEDWDEVQWSPYMYGMATTGYWSISSMRGGYAGYVGLQSMCYIKYEDGSVMFDDAGNYYTHATANLPDTAPTSGINQWRHVHGVILKVSPTTYKATPVSTICGYRDGAYRTADAFGPVIYDRVAGQWNWLTQNVSELGDVAARVINYYTKQNLLAQGVHVITTSHYITLPLDGTNGHWDADAVRVGGNWLFTCAERSVPISGGIYYPALYQGGANLTGTFTLIDKDTSRTHSEGIHFGQVGGVIYVLATDSTGMQAYSVTDLTEVRDFVPTGYPLTGSLHPHANLFPVPVGGSTRYLIESFDQVLGMGGSGGTYGNRVVYESELFAGNEFPVRSLPPRA